jgi:hypothetical protein
MKKLFFLSLMLILGLSISFSQLGIKGGVNLATVGGADNKMYGEDPQAKLGIAGGISYKINLLVLTIQPEALYIQKGAVYDHPYHKTTMSLDYLDIPIVVKFGLPIPLVNPYIEGGIAYSILLSAKSKTEYTALAGNMPSDETDIKDTMTKNDFSVVVGIGIEVFMLDINARYILGMTKLNKDNDAKSYNRGFLLTAGIRL